MARYKEYGYDIQDGKAIIPEWETEVKEEAFKDCNELTRVELPQWIKKIGKSAFRGCENLTEITLPEWVEEIEESAFNGCKNLKSITLPRWVKKIGEDAFSYCSSLTSISIPPSVTEIGSSAFWDCSSLTSIIVSKDNKVYDSRGDCNAIIHTESNTLIRGCMNTVIPESISKVGRHAFCGCSSLTSISIPTSVTEIGNDAFNRCDSLNSVHISDIAAWCNIKFNGTLRSAHHLYLNGEEIKDLVIPSSVTKIGWGAFFGCSSLTSISVSKDNNIYDSREDCNAIIHTESNTLILGCENTIIPESVTEIGSSAFYACSRLTSISIPPSVTDIGDDAFYGCKNLTHAEGPAFIAQKLPKEQLASFVISEGETKIEGKWHTEYDEYNYLYNRLIGAFEGCSSLTSITIPPSVTEIGDGTFSDCSSLTSISIPPSVTKIGHSAFWGCSSLTSITIPPSVTEIGHGAFRGCSSLTSITVSPSVTEIRGWAFEGCTSLTSITIPESVTEIGDWAFRGCSSLTSITVSKDNKVYDSREDCNAIIHTESNTLISGCKNTIIPPSVKEIGWHAFDGCSSLTSISIPPSVTKIATAAFFDCYSLTSITIPPSVKEIGSRAFSGCSSLTSITIPESVTEIGFVAFSGCTSLAEVRIPKDCIVDEFAFKDSPNVQFIRY